MHFGPLSDFAASHADALKHGATIMHETNPSHHHALAGSVRSLIDKLFVIAPYAVMTSDILLMKEGFMT